MAILTKYPNGTWFDKFTKEYAKTYGGKSPEIDIPADITGRLKELDDLVEIDTQLAKWIVRLRTVVVSGAAASAATAPATPTTPASASSSFSNGATTASPTPAPPSMVIEGHVSPPSPGAWHKVNVTHVDHPHNIFLNLHDNRVKFIQYEVGAQPNGLQRVYRV